MRVVTAAEMRELDRQAIEEYGIPGVVLMENAGIKVVEVIREMLGDVRGKKISIFVGKGNNGGDGLVVARHLFNLGAGVKVYLLASPEEITGDAFLNLRIWQKMGQEIRTIADRDEFDLEESDLLVDAIFGTGFRGVPREPAASVIEAINASGKPVVAVDIPSGLEADTGLARGPCIRAVRTVTFGLPKLGLVLEPGASYAGKLHVADISIPAFLLTAGHLKRRLLSLEMVSRWFSPRSPTAHKGTCGRVLVVAGSRGMTGAACLAAEGAARAGAGLVTLAVPEGLQKVAAAKLTEVMTVGLPATAEQTLSKESYAQTLALAERADVLALGPGITTHPETAAFVRKLLPSLRIPCVLDADGLNCLAGRPEIFRAVPVSVVITPHPGELARLTGKTVGQIQEDRIGAAAQAAQNWRVIALLKGAATVIASPAGEVYLNPTGNPGMATGGSGDVLTGVIAGLMAQGLDALSGAAAGAFLHGRAGDLAAKRRGVRGLLARDLLDCLPEAIREVEVLIGEKVDKIVAGV
ncbi:MAG: NAD(P)H-hydrate dehydratase [Bacillota bacterium]